MPAHDYFGQDKKRYQTRRIAEELPLEIRILLWQMIDSRRDRKEKLDYLQIFSLSKAKRMGEPFLMVRHYQEVPKYEKNYELIGIDADRAGKVYCIDDGTVCTMLWADEY